MGMMFIGGVNFFTVVRMMGYDGPISLENEDLSMDQLTSVKKSTKVLQEAMPRDFDSARGVGLL